MSQLSHHYYTWRIREQGSNTYTMLFYEQTFIIVPMFQEIKGPIIYITFGRSLSSWYPKKLYSIAHAKKVCLVSQINCDSILNFFTFCFRKTHQNNEKNIFCTLYEGRREVKIFYQFSKLVRDSDYATYFKFFEKLRKGFEKNFAKDLKKTSQRI